MDRMKLIDRLLDRKLASGWGNAPPICMARRVCFAAAHAAPPSPKK